MKIKIENLNKNYGEHEILKNININLENISSVGIIGESGCGKSTLLRLLSGIEKPETGKIEINDLSPIDEKVEFQKEISVVFQKHNLFPHLTVKKNISLILNKIKKIDKKTADKKAEEMLSRFFLENEKNKLPHQVSGGQAQRASIARALATEPKIVFLDEPTAALDPILTQEVLKAVEELKNQGKDFIFVTHEIEFLKNFAGYVIFLKDGKICEHGYNDCLTNPKTKELCEFLRI